MKRIGYYAMHKETENLYQFKWATDDTFEVDVEGVWEEANPHDYEIVELAILTADD